MSASEIIATEIAFLRERIAARPPRLVAIGRCVGGRGFVVTTGGAATVKTPADFAEAAAEVLGRPATVALDHDAIEGEHIGEDIMRQPFLY